MQVASLFLGANSAMLEESKGDESMEDEQYVITVKQAETSGGEVTHKTKDGTPLAIDGRVLLLPGERLYAAFEGSIIHGDDNFGSGRIAVTDTRLVFAGKGAVQGIVSAIERAVGTGNTFLMFGANKIDRAETHGIFKKCRVYVKETGWRGKEKFEKYDLKPKGESKNSLPEIVDAVNMLAGHQARAWQTSTVQSPEDSVTTPIRGHDDNGAEPNYREQGDTTASTSCPGCSEPMEASWVACPYCGKDLPRYCQTCGAEMDDEWVACPFCSSRH